MCVLVYLHIKLLAQVTDSGKPWHERYATVGHRNVIFFNLV
jgi:hypothetical protein